MSLLNCLDNRTVRALGLLEGSEFIPERCLASVARLALHRVQGFKPEFENSSVLGIEGALVVRDFSITRESITVQSSLFYSFFLDSVLRSALAALWPAVEEVMKDFAAVEPRCPIGSNSRLNFFPHKIFCSPLVSTHLIPPRSAIRFKLRAEAIL